MTAASGPLAETAGAAGGDKQAGEDKFAIRSCILERLCNRIPAMACCTSMQGERRFGQQAAAFWASDIMGCRAQLLTGVACLRTSAHQMRRLSKKPGKRTHRQQTTPRSAPILGFFSVLYTQLASKILGFQPRGKTSECVPHLVCMSVCSCLNQKCLLVQVCGPHACMPCHALPAAATNSSSN